jgi:hypothetical protein
MKCEVLDGQPIFVDTRCLNCNTEMQDRPARALICRRATQFTENAERVWLFSRNGLSVFHKVCRAKVCSLFLDNPVLPPAPDHPEALFEDSIYHRGSMRFLSGAVTERPWPVRSLALFQDARSLQMKQFVKDESGLWGFCDYTDDHGLRCVGAWSGQEEIDAVHHYACLFAQETSKDSGVWMPYWFRDARLNGTNRVAYLIKGAESYQGAVMMDTLGYHTLAWVWLTPRLRRGGIFSSIVWRQLEGYHKDFKVLAPLSKAMRSFLIAKDPHGTHEIVTETGSS